MWVGAEGVIRKREGAVRLGGQRCTCTTVHLVTKHPRHISCCSEQEKVCKMWMTHERVWPAVPSVVASKRSCQDTRVCGTAGKAHQLRMRQQKLAEAAAVATATITFRNRSNQDSLLQSFHQYMDKHGDHFTCLRYLPEKPLMDQIAALLAPAAPANCLLHLPCPRLLELHH